MFKLLLECNKIKTTNILKYNHSRSINYLYSYNNNSISINQHRQFKNFYSTDNNDNIDNSDEKNLKNQDENSAKFKKQNKNISSKKKILKRKRVSLINKSSSKKDLTKDDNSNGNNKINNNNMNNNNNKSNNNMNNNNNNNNNSYNSMNNYHSNKKNQPTNNPSSFSNIQQIKTIPKQVVVIPLLERFIYPSQGVSLTFENEYKEMGSPTHIGFFLITDEEKKLLTPEEIQKIKSFSGGIQDISKLNRVGVLAEYNPDKKYLMGSQLIQITGIAPPPEEAKNIELEEEIEEPSISTSTIGTSESVPAIEIAQTEFLTTPVVPPPTKSKYLNVLIEPFVAKAQDESAIRPLFLQLAKNVNILAENSPEIGLRQRLSNIRRTDPDLLSENAAFSCASSSSEYQKFIECNILEEKLKMAIIMSIKKYQVIQFHGSIEKQIEEKAIMQQKRFALMEQMKILKKELGLDQDEKEALKNKFNQRWENIHINDNQIKQVFNEEMTKFSGLESQSSEYNVTRNYLDWITSLPWNVFSSDCLDISKIKKSLDNDHYGLKDVKEMIQTFIAVGKLRGSIGGKIILIVGPPGTGKTSIGKSIAKSLDRQFYRISVGGLSDVHEIKGHRRTYLGAMPGKIIQALKFVKTSNPVILIDEIDKISQSSHHGDPTSTLLEILDPQQNKSFTDYYLDLPYDLSKVLFICTANSLHTIPPPLLDRMDVIRLNGYVQSEQMEIAKHYLIPNIRTETGMTEDQVTVSDDSIKQLCEFYCRESGVRNLKKTIEKIFRKIAHKIATGEETQVNVVLKNLEKYAGPIKYRSNRLFDKAQPGIVMGLGFSSGGGGLLYIESVVERFVQGGGLRTTGSLGDVTKESIYISYSYVKEFLAHLDPSNHFFDHNSIHIHAPDGSTEKDISSAGITIVSSFLSLATNKACKLDLAMVGEITLTGKVIGVTGLTDKIIAAKRESVKTILIPKDNLKQLEEIPNFIKEGLEFYLVSYYKDVYKIAFTEDHDFKPLIFKSTDSIITG
ncbi:hypothetical protein DICPUDRAFT_154583 [Dictyostelium purpureum]|uniref:endopeptidase La n=1 Tax=Dictyostelium purpureum TaxID=5786 RepID=F0ZRQ4_DICPU|nr:uncharacterized protein DICPUDRAFT_154583 [Dictyostelium purpureum]EGC33391.1 hypothetical protein DICPUDRAFT_154583 [Dictyostelium purpureum]|eukprot:XP_003290099.1 hypothetical protein DICPUDRAFT_154583 [Dictyostelium purpureum]